MKQTIVLNRIEVTVESVGNDVVATYYRNQAYHYKVNTPSGVLDSATQRSQGYKSQDGAKQAGLRKLRLTG